MRLESGDFVPADVVVSNVDALTTYRDLLPAPGAIYEVTGPFRGAARRLPT